ncbi:phosphate acetyltransferase [Aliiroseovarius sediminilitoris]|uniref:Phosphate acetyltransferase n=1 Tax=Aliiroseovarius sediminilitoris TaxID=1173584 RepID=A0A1I0Q973_9RHOB|nr:phosphate acyltransferase [Aliiroseovarius sediminilitoris]SEW23097.1 phosphate acetyltransferase [Aliiroseovarius sediminilitoris]
MSALERATQIARTAQARVILPELDDPRIVAVGDRLRREGLAVPVPLAERGDHHIEALMTSRPMRESIAARMLERPLMRAAAMVASGEADILVAGAIAPSRRVIEAVSIVIGLEEGTTTPSSFFLMVTADGREMIFADCAVNVDPDAAQLTDIAQVSQISAQRLLGAASVALLSYSTGRSGIGVSVDKVAHAAELSGFPGPVQGDAALNRAVAAQKGSTGLGDANVLVFPNLDAGNIAYKLLVELAGARAYGPILQGFKRPVCDLSRGATVDDIVASTVLAIAADQMARSS